MAPTQPNPTQPAPDRAPDLAQRLSLILQALRAVIAARAGRDRAVVPVALLLWPYLHRLAARFAAMVRRVQSGRAAARPVRVTRPESRPPRPLAHPLAPRLPCGFAWLIRLAPEAAALAQQVRHLMADPAIAPLLAAAPQAGRLLRPLRRMLGIEPGPDLPPALFGAPPARPRGPWWLPSPVPAIGGRSARAAPAAPDRGGGFQARPVPG